MLNIPMSIRQLNVLICKEVILKKTRAETLNKMVVLSLFNLWNDTMGLKSYYVKWLPYIYKWDEKNYIYIYL